MVCTVSFGNSSVSLHANCTCKKFTKFIINEINKDNLIREKFYKKQKIENILVNNYVIVYFIYLNLVLLFVNLMITHNILKFLIKI